jgi:hypothetical protein
MRLAICVLVCSLGVAHADTLAQTAAADAYRDGQRHYAAGEYPAAAASFLAAHDSVPDPVYIFNAAQAFRFAGDCIQAASHYRRFLAAVSTAPNLDRVRGYLDEMDACAKRLAPPPQPPAPPRTAAAAARPAAPDDRTGSATSAR